MQDDAERPEDVPDRWAPGLSRLSALNADLSQYAMADDVLLLHERVRHLGCHWEELCLKVRTLVSWLVLSRFLTRSASARNNFLVVPGDSFGGAACPLVCWSVGLSLSPVVRAVSLLT